MIYFQRQNDSGKRLAKFLAGLLAVAVFSAAIDAYGVTITWDPNSDGNVTGYRLYYGIASHSYANRIDVGNATTTTISNLTSGVTYYFAATAYNSSGLESDFSTEVTYTPGTSTSTLATMRISAAAPGQPFALTVAGQTGHIYEIQATTNFINWTVIGTVAAAADGSLQFTDPAASNFPSRFYRTRDTSL
ncbi:MAG: fibronectin type III domain-containing protein [Limisphaerales bacterium]